MTVEDGMPNSSSAPEVRLVKCPKCRQVLQESADIPIYRCGGCGVILQVKHRKNDLKIMGPDHQKNDEIPPKESNNASEDKDLGSLTRDVRVPSSAENSVDFEEPRDQSITVNGEHFMPKEETSMCMDGDQPGRHEHSNAEDNGERDGESGGIQSSTELESRENGGSLPIELESRENGGSLRIDERNSEREASRESSTVPHENPAEETKGSDLKDNEMITSESSSGDNSTEKPAEEITPTEAPFSTGAREEQFKRNSSRAYNRRMSMDTTVSTEYVDPVSDFSGTLAETPRSPAGNFHMYHHGDLPSYDARVTHHSNRKGKEAESAIPRERFSQGKHRMNNDSEIRYPEINSRPPLSFSQEGDFIRAGGGVRDRMVEPPVRGSEGKHWRRPDRGELPPRIPANPWQQRRYYDYGGPSNQVPMYSRFNSGIHSGDVLTHPVEEKMKLLRMVHDLEDQLKRTCNLEEISRERMPPGSHWRERPSDFYYGRDRMDEDYLQMGLPAYSRIDKRDSRWRHHSRYPRRPFSAEIVETSHQPNNFYHHPVNWRRSEPLPPPAAAHNMKFYGIHNDKSIYSPYSSSPSSPQHYMDYGFSPYGYDTRSDDEVYDKEREYEKYREGKQRAKRPVMAAAGGAPWIICSCCSRLLQLPTDFLLFKKKCHRLRCGSCSTVLKFSLQNTRQLVPYVRRAKAPPPSEADERGDSLRVNTLPLDSRSNGFMQAEIVSYSDDIGMSYSTEADPACLAKLQSVGDHNAESLEAEGLQNSGNSPLHRLMGYSSVSQVFRGPEPSATPSIPKRP